MVNTGGGCTGIDWQRVLVQGYNGRLAPQDDLAFVSIPRHDDDLSRMQPAE